MANKVGIKSSEVHVAGNTTLITSPELVDALVQDKAGTVTGLKNLVAPFDASKMYVDRFGRLVVNDAKFAETLKARLAAGEHAGGTAADNLLCPPEGIGAKTNPV